MVNPGPGKQAGPGFTLPSRAGSIGKARLDGPGRAGFYPQPYHALKYTQI